LIDRKWIGHEVAKSVLDIERGRLKFFAKAVGETNPIYTDEAAAKAAGYADLPDSGSMFALFDLLSVPLSKLLHGEQGFEYLAPVVAGDTVTVSSRVKDIYDKRGGALEFVETESTAVNQHGATVAKMRNVSVIRN